MTPSGQGRLRPALNGQVAWPMCQARKATALT